MSELELYEGKLEALARERGLDYFPVNFELVPGSFMMEVAIYGLPVRMPHWSFGVHYFYQLVQHRMGHSRLFEVVFPGNPGRAYLSKNNSPQENTLIVAHVLGHADFQEQRIVPPQSGRGGLQHRREGGRACSTDFRCRRAPRGRQGRGGAGRCAVARGPR